MSRTVNLIVSCTNRKRFPAPTETAVHGIGGANLDDRLKRWKRNLSTIATAEHSAGDLYMGDHWSVVQSIPAVAEKSGLSVRTWICSAGYGLIRPTTPIKPYRATFARGELDFVASGFPDEVFALSRWWSGVCAYRFQPEPRTISALAATSPRTPIVVALSEDYLKAVTPDLENILNSAYFRQHLAIVSCGTPHSHSIWKDYLLPCDASLTGALGGTLTSLNARVVRRLFKDLQRKEPSVEALSALATAIPRSSSALAVPRAAKSDSEIASFIRTHLAQNPDFSKTHLLREFREHGNACEQKRFGKIYSRIWKPGDLDA